MAASPEEFLRLSRRYLCEEYPAKLRLAVERLSESDLWWRPGPESNAVGNLILHLAGNARQWIVSGLGRQTDVRARAAEFEAEGGRTREEVLEVLDAALSEVDATLTALNPDDLAGTFDIQGLQVGGMEALYHVVEHFSMHVGQILWIVKARTGGDLGFYEVDDSGSVVDTHW